MAIGSTITLDSLNAMLVPDCQYLQRVYDWLVHKHEAYSQNQSEIDTALSGDSAGQYQVSAFIDGLQRTIDVIEGKVPTGNADQVGNWAQIVGLA